MASIKVKSEENDQQSQANQIIFNNLDLTTQILLRLPPKSITNLKLTSKQWLSISCDPIFIRNHTLRHVLTLTGLFVHYVAQAQPTSHEYVASNKQIIETNNRLNTPSPTTFVAEQNSFGLNILQSCNGLLLCSSSDTEYYVINPTTMQRKQVLLPKGVRPAGGDFGLNLAFDPKISTVYKVVCVRRGQRSRYQVEVYSSETGQWKTVGDPFIEPNVLHFKYGVFCKGAIHWIKTTSGCLYFDINHELMKSTPDPPPGKKYPLYSHEYFAQSNDHLYFVVKRRLPNFTLLQMKDDYSGWFVKYIIDLDFLAKTFPVREMIFVVCIVNSTGGSDIDEGDIELVLSMSGELVWFNPRTNATREFGDLVHQPKNASVWYKDFLVHEYFQIICPV